eukprot:158450_1
MKYYICFYYVVECILVANNMGDSSHHPSSNEKNYRSPYVFTNLYEKDKYHGIGFHKDDVDLFTMVILLTDDFGDGVLQIKDEKDTVCKFEMNKGDAVILAKDIYHGVPVMKRDQDRIMIGLHY